MYTSKDVFRRGLLIPVLIFGVPIGLLVFGSNVGLSPNLGGAAMVVWLVGVVAWLIFGGRNPKAWPLPKKVLNALGAAGFKGSSDPSGQFGRVYNDDDGFAIDFSDRLAVTAWLNEKTRELRFHYRARPPKEHVRDRVHAPAEAGATGSNRSFQSWLRGEQAFDLTVWRSGSGDPLVVAGKPSEYRVEAKTPAEKRLAAWIASTLGEQIVAMAPNLLEVEKPAGDEDPKATLELTIPDGTYPEVCQVITAAKEMFWKVVAVVDADKPDDWPN